MELTYNSEERAEIHAMGNVPLGDSHAMRFTGYLVDGDHIYENQYTGEGVNDASKWGLKSRFLFDTESSTDGEGFGEFLITLDYAKEDNDCCGLAVIEYDGLSTLNAPSTNIPSRAFQELLGLNASGKPIYEYYAFEDSAGFSPPNVDPFDEDNYWFDAPCYPTKLKSAGWLQSGIRQFGARTRSLLLTPGVILNPITNAMVI